MKTRRKGAILAVALATLLVVTLLAGAILRSYLQAHRQLRRQQDQLQAQWLADGALARAATRLRQDAAYTGETWQAEVSGGSEPVLGVVTIRVKPQADQPQAVQIEVEARYPDHEWQRSTARRTLSLPSTTDN